MGRPATEAGAHLGSRAFTEGPITSQVHPLTGIGSPARVTLIGRADLNQDQNRLQPGLGRIGEVMTDVWTIRYQGDPAGASELVSVLKEFGIEVEPGEHQPPGGRGGVAHEVASGTYSILQVALTVRGTAAMVSDALRVFKERFPRGASSSPQTADEAAALAESPRSIYAMNGPAMGAGPVLSRIPVGKEIFINDTMGNSHYYLITSTVFQDGLGALHHGPGPYAAPPTPASDNVK